MLTAHILDSIDKTMETKQRMDQQYGKFFVPGLNERLDDLRVVSST